MGAIAVFAYDEMPPAATWQEWSLLSRGYFVPARNVAEFLERLRPWKDRVEPIFDDGCVVGFNVSSLLTMRSAYRLKSLVVPFLAPYPDPAPANQNVEEGCDVVLDQHGLHIPGRNVERAKRTLLGLGDILIKYDDERENIVALRVPANVDLASVLAALEIDVAAISADDAARKKRLFDGLREEIGRLSRSRTARAS